MARVVQPWHWIDNADCILFLRFPTFSSSTFTFLPFSFWMERVWSMPLLYIRGYQSRVRY